MKLRYKTSSTDFNFVYYIIFRFNLLNFSRAGYLLDSLLLGILLTCECERIENTKLQIKPGRPWGPGSPIVPFGPISPMSPFTPWGPWGPTGPCLPTNNKKKKHFAFLVWYSLLHQRCHKPPKNICSQKCVRTEICRIVRLFVHMMKVSYCKRLLLLEEKINMWLTLGESIFKMVNLFQIGTRSFYQVRLILSVNFVWWPS